MKKSFTFSCLLLFISFTSFAQLKIGAPSGAPNSSAILDLNASAANKGLLLPSVALTSTTSFAPLAAHVAGMTVYNTATVSDVTPGVYLSDGTKWARITPQTDGLRAALAAGGCASCAAYDLASADSWVSITAAEYAQINNFMTVNLAGCNETIMTAAISGTHSQNYTFSSIGSNIPLLPANNYVVAFSAMSNVANSPTDAYLKYSTATTSGFAGTSTHTLKIVGTGVATRVYNICKTPSAIINAAGTNVGIFTGATLAWIGFSNVAAHTLNYGTGDVAALPSSNGSIPMFQVKATATKTW